VTRVVFGMQGDAAARELELGRIYSAIEDQREIRDRVLTTDDGQLTAGLIATQRGDVWYIERVNARDDHAYRVMLFQPNFVTKPSMNPQDHARGNFMSEDLQTCQAFVFDVPTDAVETVTTPGGLARRLPEQYRYGIQQTLVEKRHVHSDRQVLSLHQETFNTP